MTVQIIHGDSREALKTLADNSLDACVTDPPYNLTSITKRFGKAGSAPAADGVFNRSAKGFMGQAWDSDVAFHPDVWLEAYRVLKPGAHLIAFGGTRTYHRLVCAIEDAGFEVRDQLAWLYATGFPKSHNVSKGIDKRAGAEREIVGTGKPVKRIIPGATQDKVGWIKDDGREFIPTETLPATEDAQTWNGWGSALKPAFESVLLARKPLEGTLVQNVLKWGTGALNIDASRVPSELADGRSRHGGGTHLGLGGGTRTRMGDGYPDEKHALPTGRWPANVMHDGSDEVLAGFPGSKGNKGGPRWENTGVTAGASIGGVQGGFNKRAVGEMQAYADEGSAARFFFSAKATRSERNGSLHPTVKPTRLIEYLCKLITPPGGTILDPFAGSGTTGEAAVLNGFNVILIEMEAQYIQDIHNRMAEPKVWSGVDEPSKRPKGFF